MEKKLIDIIIPAYNAHNTLVQALSSIAIQTMAKDIRVLVINDCSKNDYSEIIKSFQKILEVIEIKHEKNMGPGAARNTGLKHSLSKYIMFLDADDMFKDSWSIEYIYKEIENNQYNAVYSPIIELNEDNSIVNTIQANHFTWVLGCIFRKSFLDLNEICFINASRGEDINFNKKIKLLSTIEQIGFLNKPIYLWTDANASNRLNTDEFVKIKGRLGLAEGIAEAYSFIEEKQLFIPMSLKDQASDYLSNLISIYFSCIEADEEEKGISQKIINVFKDYYKKHAYKFNPYITKKEIEECYYINFKGFFNNKGFPKNAMSFDDFIQKLEKDLDTPKLASITDNIPIFSVIVTIGNNKKNIRRLLTSILTCGLPKDKIEVLICDSDISDIKYIIDSFNQGINIQIINGTEKDGYIQATGKWITFINSDDFFVYGSFIQAYDFIIQDKLQDVLFTVFYEYDKEKKIYLDTIFDKDNYLYGKFYNREFLLKNNIQFNNNILYFHNQIFIAIALSGKDKPGYYDYKLYNKVFYEKNNNYNLDIKEYIYAIQPFIDNFYNNKIQTYCLFNIVTIFLKCYFIYQQLNIDNYEDIRILLNKLHTIGITNKMFITFVEQNPKLFIEIRNIYIYNTTNFVEHKSFEDFIVTIES